MEHRTNQIILRGSLQELPVFSHENHGKKFYKFFLEVPRLSGAVDILPVVAEEQLLETLDLTGGSMITVTGQIRSHNITAVTGRHLMIFVFASSLIAEDGPALNDVTLEGVICKQPNYRRTPLGREICDVMIAVGRAFHRADYLPCIFWGRTAQDASEFQVRDTVTVKGRLQSRVYSKYIDDQIQERTAYEISALNAEFSHSGAE